MKTLTKALTKLSNKIVTNITIIKVKVGNEKKCYSFIPLIISCTCLLVFADIYTVGIGSGYKSKG